MDSESQAAVGKRYGKHLGTVGFASDGLPKCIEFPRKSKGSGAQAAVGKWYGKHLGTLGFALFGLVKCICLWKARILEPRLLWDNDTERTLGP